jgi:hypothetical protein
MLINDFHKNNTIKHLGKDLALVGIASLSSLVVLAHAVCIQSHIFAALYPVDVGPPDTLFDPTVRADQGGIVPGTETLGAGPGS